MRLIDVDVAKKAVHEEFDECLVWDESGEHTANVIEEILEALPIVEAEPVTRCKDCKHYYKKEWVVGGGSYTTCWYQTIANAQPNDFCSRAERKEE